MNASVVSPLDFSGSPVRAGAGAASVVYRAVGGFGRTVAEKEPRPESAAMGEMPCSV